jgi:hypothetical protein
MSVIGTESLAVSRPPGTHNLILRYGEQKIAIAVELDLVEGPFLCAKSLSVGLLLFFFIGVKKRENLRIPLKVKTHMARKQNRPHIGPTKL